MRIIADLHIHTNASDGLLLGPEVVTEAVAAGLKTIAITDHDTVNGLGDVLSAAKDNSMQVICGVELSTELEHKEIHILGYFIDYTHKPLLALFKELQVSRFTRAEKMVRKLNYLGYTINMENVMRFAGNAAPGRPHVGRALVENGYFENVRESFNKLLGYKLPGYVGRYKISPTEAISIIKDAGGFASWAHPGLSALDYMLPRFIADGLKGVEAYHPDHDKTQTLKYVHLATKYDLFVTGGSDFHGGEGPNVRKLGCCGIYEKDLHSILTFRQK